MKEKMASTRKTTKEGDLTLTKQDVVDYIKRTKRRKAPGPDNISTPVANNCPIICQLIIF